jgi:hypothetical protein
MVNEFRKANLMVNVHRAIKQGTIVNQENQYDIDGILIRGGENVAILATSKQSGEEISSGLEVDLPSLIDFCKHVLIETGTLPKWFFFGVIVDAPHSQLLTYFSPGKEKFFSDIYKYIKENLADDLLMADTETVVKNFFERNRDYHFNYLMIPLDSLITGSAGNKVDTLDIRF